MLDFLRQEGIEESIICRIEDFRSQYPAAAEDEYRISVPKYH